MTPTSKRRPITQRTTETTTTMRSIGRQARRWHAPPAPARLLAPGRSPAPVADGAVRPSDRGNRDRQAQRRCGGMALSRCGPASESGASSRACSERAQRAALGMSPLRGRLEPDDQLCADPHAAHRLSEGGTGALGLAPAGDRPPEVQAGRPVKTRVASWSSFRTAGRTRRNLRSALQSRIGSTLSARRSSAGWRTALGPRSPSSCRCRVVPESGRCCAG